MNSKNKSRVLVQGINYYPERTGMGKYTAGMVDYMVQQGIECTVITSYPFHPEWKVEYSYKNGSYTKKVSDNGLFTIYRCPMFVPANPTGFTRIIQEASFITSSFFVLLKLMFQKNFDAFIIISPPFHLGLVALLYKKFKKTKIIYHIQDLQIDLAKELEMIKNQNIIKILFKIEKYILSKVDHVCTISDGMIGKIKLKENINVVSFPNWVDTKQFFPIENHVFIKNKWNFSENDFVVLYSGNVGEKQGLEIILDVAVKFNTTPNIKFIICGNGAYKQRLIEQADKTKTTNIYFVPLQPEKDFNDFLNIADVHLIIQKENAADLVMPSKLTTILAVGGKIIATANPKTTLYNVIVDNNIGIVTEPENTKQLYQAIFDMSKKPGKVSKLAREYAVKHLSVNTIMQRFLKDVNL